jgi:hypothetical protein
MPYGPSPSEESLAKRLRKPRTKSYQVSLELEGDDFEALNRWLARAAVDLGQPLNTMTLARGIRAMIRAAEIDDAVRGVVLDVLRTDQS